MPKYLRVLNSPVVLWVALSLPACIWIYGYSQETIFYGELLHASADLAARLLIATMAITPLGLMFPAAAGGRWFKQRRRHMGVAAFFYSMLHAVVYIQHRPESAFILEQARDVSMWTGWLALLLMGILAATSNDICLHALKRGWKKLHRAVYIVAVLTFIHWILTAFDPLSAILHLGVLISLEAYRLKKTYLNRL